MGEIFGLLVDPQGAVSSSPGSIRQTMQQKDGTLERLLRGTSDANYPFAELCTLLRKLGFGERVRGDHHIFTRDGVAEILNLQPKQGKAKPYQVRQVRNIVLKYRLGGGADAV